VDETGGTYNTSGRNKKFLQILVRESQEKRLLELIMLRLVNNIKKSYYGGMMRGSLCGFHWFTVRSSVGLYEHRETSDSIKLVFFCTT
jgi:hypothetical protein